MYNLGATQTTRRITEELQAIIWAENDENMPKTDMPLKHPKEHSSQAEKKKSLTSAANLASSSQPAQVAAPSNRGGDLSNPRSAGDPSNRLPR